MDYINSLFFNCSIFYHYCRYTNIYYQSLCSHGGVVIIIIITSDDDDDIYSVPLSKRKGKGEIQILNQLPLRVECV